LRKGRKPSKGGLALVLGTGAGAGAGSADLQWSWESQGRLWLETLFGDYA